MRPAEKRELVHFVCEEHGLSISRACTALRMSRTVFAYKPSPRDDMPVSRHKTQRGAFQSYLSGRGIELLCIQQVKRSTEHRR